MKSQNAIYRVYYVLNKISKIHRSSNGRNKSPFLQNENCHFALAELNFCKVIFSFYSELLSGIQFVNLTVICVFTLSV